MARHQNRPRRRGRFGRAAGQRARMQSLRAETTRRAPRETGQRSDSERPDSSTGRRAPVPRRSLRLPWVTRPPRYAACRRISPPPPLLGPARVRSAPAPVGWHQSGIPQPSAGVGEWSGAGQTRRAVEHLTAIRPPPAGVPIRVFIGGGEMRLIVPLSRGSRGLVPGGGRSAGPAPFGALGPVSSRAAIRAEWGSRPAPRPPAAFPLGRQAVLGRSGLAACARSGVPWAGPYPASRALPPALAAASLRCAAGHRSPDARARRPGRCAAAPARPTRQGRGARAPKNRLNPRQWRTSLPTGRLIPARIPGAPAKTKT